MKTLVENVLKFNGRVLYGIDNNDIAHDVRWAKRKRNGAYATNGQVAVIMNSDGSIVDTQLFTNRDKAYRYLLANVKSEGIVA